MRPKLIFSLRVKLTIFTTFLIALVGAIVMTATSGLVRERLSLEIKEKGVAIAKNVARSSEDALVGKGDELYLFQFITSAMKQKGVSYVRIVDGQGIVRADSDIQKSGARYNPPPWLGTSSLIPPIGVKGQDYELIEGRSPDGNILYDIKVPVMLAGAEKKTLGEVHLGLSGKVIEDAVRQMQSLIGEIALAGLLLGGLGAFTLAKFTVKPIALLVEGVNEIGRGNLDQEIKIKRGDEIGELTAAFNDMARGLREKELIKDSFGRYMDKRLAEKLIREPEKMMQTLGGEHRYATILFTDIRGFTSMAEALDPKGVISFLNDYFSMMVDVVEKNGGFIDKFIGDAMMVLYGVPVKADDDAPRAVRTALMMRDAMRGYNGRLAAQGKAPIHIGIGINSGIVVAGNVGSRQRMNYTVVGDAVNLAARLVSLSKEEDVIISEATYHLVKDQFIIEKKEKAAIKGKQELQQVYEVLGEKNA